MSDKKEIVTTDSKKVIIRMIIFIVAVIALVASFILFITSGSVALNSAIKSSEETFLSEKEKTYEDFKETISLVEEVKFASLFTFIFKFSQKCVWCRWWDSNPHGIATNGF